MMEDSLTLDVTAGVISMLVEAGIGTWDETGIYTEATTPPGIVVGRLPQTPAAVIGVNPYIAQMDAQPGTDIRAVQIRIRTPSRDPRPAIRTVDQLEELLHGRENLTFSGHPVPLIWRHSLADLGVNDQDQYELTDNYYMFVDTKKGS